eukprot:GFUD01019263.1.p2 GENE.GFUD01019263.1~~GFUD01019263.1.p2  ORF type:complete len:180 (-),score=57.75 GFUD01019263.1:42-581(-)
MLSLGCAVLLAVLGLGHGETTEDKIQTELYILAGVFGGITVVLVVMVLTLSCTIARLNHEVKAAGEKVQSPGAKSRNTPNIPDMNGNIPKNYMNEPNRQPGPGYGPSRDEISLEPVHNHRAEPRPRQPEYEDNYSYQPQQHGQDYPRGEDRTSQYSWEPLPRRGEESRLPRLNYGQSRR